MSEFKFLKLNKKKDPVKGNDLEYIKKKNAVCIALFDEKVEYTILVKQYRVGSDKYELEIPAGLIENGENQKDAVIRELREETGYNISMIENIVEYPNDIFVAPAFTTEKLYFYATKLKSNDIKPLDLKLDETENIEVEWMKISDVESNIQDLKTLFAINYFKDKV